MTLEITHREPYGVHDWAWDNILQIKNGERVRLAELESSAKVGADANCNAESNQPVAYLHADRDGNAYLPAIAERRRSGWLPNEIVPLYALNHPRDAQS